MRDNNEGKSRLLDDDNDDDDEIVKINKTKQKISKCEYVCVFTM
jgi:hypothetical protein